MYNIKYIKVQVTGIHTFMDTRECLFYLNSLGTSTATVISTGYTGLIYYNTL
jgi:hypothetical protein